MTEQDYVLLCIGAKDKALNDLKTARFIAWSSFIAPRVDGASAPKTITQFLPLDGDSKSELQPIPREYLIEWDKKFRALA